MRELKVPTPGRIRPRRLRMTQTLRNFAAETDLSAARMIMPHFLLPDVNAKEPIPSLPGIEQLGAETLLRQVEQDLALGIRSVLLFAQPPAGSKRPDGRAAAASDGTVQHAITRLKQTFGEDLLVITDVCLCAYTDHGHCGLIENDRVANDPSLAPLVATAVSHARAGADVVAPSDMMDGRVAAIRDGLDQEGFSDVALLAYSVKYASAYYGPFRDAADSAPAKGDRQSYQMDCRNVREALREVALDVSEGADMLMVKPALAYLDVIRAVREASTLPLVAYNVSGEYAAVKAAAANGWLDEAAIVRENLIGMRRAGADQIITYHVRDALKGGWF
jgi:porphobilinogen synthase